ncbi:MAG: hypothetical protein Q9187_006385 [Circinaria calcarea]
MYLISGPSNINLIWRNSDTFTPKAIQLMGMRNILKLKPNGASFCESDDSGRGPRPHPKSNVEPENRIWFHTHDTSARYLSGLHLNSLSSYFQYHLKNRIGALSLDNQWSETTDLYSLIFDIIFPTQIEALFGTSFLSLNPNFASDFREFHRGLTYLLRGYPRWLIPKTWRARERCLEDIKKWHIESQKQQDGKILSGEERYISYGSDYIRARKHMHAKMKLLDADAIASSELGVIWAANSNIITAIAWFIIELVKDPALLLKVRAETAFSVASDPDSLLHININKLSTQPFVQSAYAETLRLRTYNLLVTTSEHADFKFRDWIFPKDQMVAISSHTAHMDAGVWNTGSNCANHPLDTFWAERFLNSPSNPLDGPLKAEYASRRKLGQAAKSQDRFQDDTHTRDFPTNNASISPNSPRFSLAGLSGIWVPFGGGYSLCPGRHLAKEEILLSVAMLTAVIEFDFIQDDSLWYRLRGLLGKMIRDFKPDMRYFGMGVLPPNEVRIRYKKSKLE